jgi:hypothetical protein
LDNISIVPLRRDQVCCLAGETNLHKYAVLGDDVVIGHPVVANLATTTSLFLLFGHKRGIRLYIKQHFSHPPVDQSVEIT